MSKAVRISIVSLWAAACLTGIYLLAGLISVNSGLSWNGIGDLFRFAIGGKVVSDITLEKPAENIRNLRINVPHNSLELAYASTDKIRVVQYGPEDIRDDELVQIKETDDGYEITTSDPLAFYIAIHIVTGKIVVELPEAFRGKLDASSASGTIWVRTPLNAESIRLASTYGAVRAVQPLGSRQGITLTSSSGSVCVMDMEAAGDITCSSISGSVRLEGRTAAGGCLKASSSSGSVNISHASAESGAELISTSGSIHADWLETDGTAFLKSVSGSVNSGYLKAFAAAMESMSGSVRMEDDTLINGDLKATSTSGSISGSSIECDTFYGRSTSGSVRIEKIRPKTTAELSSSSGSVTVGVPRELEFVFRGESGSGSVKSDDYELSYTGSSRKNGGITIGGGIVTISAKSGSGSVKLESA